MALHDTAGLRNDQKTRKKAARAVAPPAAAASTASPATPATAADAGTLLGVDEVFDRRCRMLDFWVAAQGAPVVLRMYERTHCSAELLAVDSAQTLMHLDGLVTPMGTYRRATVRSGDLLCAELGGDWRVDFEMPQPPTAAEEERWELEAAKLALSRQLENVDLSTDGGDGNGESGGGDDGGLDGNGRDGNHTHGSGGGGAVARGEAEAGMSGATDEAAHIPTLRKYWMQRYMLFSKYDEGVRLDQEGWYSVTPEVMAAHIAERCRCDLIVDAFAGVGGNAIQFAFSCERVYAIDLDDGRLQIARHNARVYDVEDRIEFLHGDFMQLAGGPLSASHQTREHAQQTSVTALNEFTPRGGRRPGPRQPPSS